MTIRNSRLTVSLRESAYVHLTHLRKVHKLVIVRKDGVLRYDVAGMKGKENGKTSRKR
jgi:hypothetical protein